MLRLIKKHKNKMTKQIIKVESINLEMNNTQENYIPHWIVRTSDVFVSEFAKLYLKDVELITRTIFLNKLCEVLKMTEKKHLFSGLSRFQEVKIAVADITKNDLRTQTKAHINALMTSESNALTEKEVRVRMTASNKYTTEEINSYFKVETKDLF